MIVGLKGPQYYGVDLSIHTEMTTGTIQGQSFKILTYILEYFEHKECHQKISQILITKQLTCHFLTGCK